MGVPATLWSTHNESSPFTYQDPVTVHARRNTQQKKPALNFLEMIEPMNPSTIKLFALSGSLRQHSSNTQLLQAVVAVAPPTIAIDLYNSLHELPHFNPDEDPQTYPAVLDLFARVRVADGLIVSTPEYARGVPGSLKNALDWWVGSDAFVEKPFVLFNASNRSTHAQASLITTLQTMSGIHVAEADLTIHLLGKGETVETLLATDEYHQRLLDALTRFVEKIGSTGD